MYDWINVLMQSALPEVSIHIEALKAFNTKSSNAEIIK